MCYLSQFPKAKYRRGGSKKQEHDLILAVFGLFAHKVLVVLLKKFPAWCPVGIAFWHGCGVSAILRTINNQ
jgi:hypothetical protein